MDEDELLAELEEMEAEQLDSELMEPAVPTKSAAASLVSRLGCNSATRRKELLYPIAPRAPVPCDSDLSFPFFAATEVDAGLPSVPTGKVQAPAKTPEELELEQLQAEMAL